MKDLKNKVNDLNSLIKKGEIMEAFEKYYGEDVVIQENGNSPLTGKGENRKRGIVLLNDIDEFFGAEIISSAFENGLSMTEWAIDIKSKSTNMRKIIYRVNVQHWKDDKIINEKLYFCGDQRF